MLQKRANLVNAVLLAVSLLGSAALVAWACLLPVERRGLAAPAAPLRSVGSDGDEQVRNPSLDGFGRLWDKPLRGPGKVDANDDSQAVDRRPPPPPRPAAHLTLRLVGIALEADRSQAMFGLPDGGISFGSVGDQVGVATDRARIVSIQPTQVVLMHHDRHIALDLPRD